MAVWQIMNVRVTPKPVSRTVCIKHHFLAYITLNLYLMVL